MRAHGRTVNLNVKMLPSPAPQKFTTFNTFCTFAMFAIFAKFAKFAKFANINPAMEHPTPIHRHAPRLGSLSECASRTSPLSCLRRERGARGVRVPKTASGSRRTAR